MHPIHWHFVPNRSNRAISSNRNEKNDITGEERLLSGRRTMHLATAAAVLLGGRRLTHPTSEHRRNIDAQYRSPLHFLELWSITDALSRRRGSATTIRRREEGRK